MAIGNLQGLPKESPYTVETVDRVKDLLNAGLVDVSDVSQYFGVPKALVIQSLTDIPPSAFTSGNLNASQVEKVQELINNGVASTSEVSDYFKAPVEIVERNLTEQMGYTPAQLAEARAGLPVSPAPYPAVEVTPTPTLTPTPEFTPTPEPMPTPITERMPPPTPEPMPTLTAQNPTPAITDQMTPLVTTQYETGSEIPTGLRGSEMALKGGAAGAIEMLDMLNRAGRSDLADRYAKGLEQAAASAETASGFMQPFQQAGETALQLQLALSGALGPEEFQKAYQESPQIQFLREQGEQGVMRNAAAMGGLGGGNVQKELSRFNQGLASQGLQQQIQNMSGLASQGQQASGTLANIATGLGSQQLQTQVGLGQGLAGQSSMYGLPAAQSIGNLGINLAAGRTQAGRDLANQYGAAASGLSNIYSAQGQNLANMLGGQRNLIMDQRTQAALNEARAQQGYGSDMANIQSGVGSAIAGVPNVPLNTPDYQNQAMNALYAAGMGYDMFDKPQQQNTFTPTNPNQTFTAAQTAGFTNWLYPNQAAANIAAAPMTNPYTFNPAAQAAANLTK